MEFREKCLKNDETLRSIFKINPVQEQAPQRTATIDLVEEDEDEVITLNPNKLYESSDSDSDVEPSSNDVTTVEREQQQLLISIQDKPVADQKSNKPKIVGSIVNKKEIFHCRYCDIAFSDSNSCFNHESCHNQLNPFECRLCDYKTDQHTNLIFHVKETHDTQKPFICHCGKQFMRRSDLRKHAFTHAGIRLFSCNLCTKSFTRNSNLTKHKKVHSEDFKTFSCQICTKSFLSKTDLSRHVEIHMERTSIKYSAPATEQQNLPVHEQMIPAAAQPTINFYNRPQEPAMNFYTENSAFQIDSFNQTRQMHDFSVGGYNANINQPTIHQAAPPFITKNFVCGICNSAYFKKKELDRHVMSIHTNVSFSCLQCSRSFNRKDKLIRHEKSHLLPQFYNCPLCSAVFLRKNMLEIHAKIHEMPNGGQQQQQHDNYEFNQSLPGQQIIGNNGYSMENVQHAPVSENTQQYYQTPMVIDDAQQQEHKPPTPEMANLHPMNLSMDRSSAEPMDLSNDKLEQSKSYIQSEMKAADFDDDEGDGLQIVEDPDRISNDASATEHSTNASAFSDAPVTDQKFPQYQPAPLIPILPIKTEEPITISDNETPELKINDNELKGNDEVQFPMIGATRITTPIELAHIEPLRDLPSEILQHND